MKPLKTWTVILGTVAGGLAYAGAEAPAGHSPYLRPAVMASAGVQLEGNGLPGENVEAWLSKPAEGLVFLEGEWADLLSELYQIGDLSVLTGNAVVMHLATGQYEPFRGDGAHALVLNEGIDLRLFPGRWKYGIAILPGHEDPAGLAFFDGSGAPVHRVLLTESSNIDAFEEIVADYAGEKPVFSPATEVPEPTVTPDEATRAALLEDWRALTDTHDFGGLLREYKLSRTDALRLAQGEFTAQLERAAYASVFDRLVEAETSIILFALNEGCVQISTGALTATDRSGDALQLVEKDSRTLVALPKVAEVWRVSKPTDHGVMHSLELYDAAGEAVAYIFGSRKGDDDTNLNQWNDLLFSLPVAGISGEAAAASSEAEPAAATAAEGCAKSGECPKAAAASSEGEKEAGCCADTPKVSAAAAPVEPLDTFNMPRRLRSQLSYTVKRMLAFDKNDDGRLSQDELPRRMAGLVERGSLNGDAFLDEDELTRIAYQQIQQRDAAAEAESADRRAK